MANKILLALIFLILIFHQPSTVLGFIRSAQYVIRASSSVPLFGIRQWIKESLFGEEIPEKSESEIMKETYFNRPGPWDEKDLDSLMGANKAWISRMVTEQPDFFEEIRKGHAPKILWIGCSDARVPANEIIGRPPGDIFVHRNIANQVVNTDFNCMSVIQYAVDVLKVKHIMVCGHYDCGGVKAALENTDHRSPLENWLRHIRDTYRLHKGINKNYYLSYLYKPLFSYCCCIFV